MQCELDAGPGSVPNPLSFPLIQGCHPPLLSLSSVSITLSVITSPQTSEGEGHKTSCSLQLFYVLQHAVKAETGSHSQLSFTHSSQSSRRFCACVHHRSSDTLPISHSLSRMPSAQNIVTHCILQTGSNTSVQPDCIARKKIYLDILGSFEIINESVSDRKEADVEIYCQRMRLCIIIFPTHTTAVTD